MASEASSRTVLICGGAGFIGSHYTELACRKGYRTIVLDALTYAGNRSHLQGFPGAERITFVHGEIQDENLTFSLLQEYAVDAVLNFAAETHVDRAIEHPEPFIQSNFLGTYRLLLSTQKHVETLSRIDQSRFRYLQVSTDEVFGSVQAPGRFNERSQFQPNSPYSASKASADHLVRAWHRTYGLPAVITFSSNCFGPKQYPEKLIPKMILNALQGQSLSIYGDGENVRDWAYVTDICEAIDRALIQSEPGQSFCFGSGTEKRNIDLVQELCTLLDELSPRIDGRAHQSAIDFVPDRRGHDRRYAIDDEYAQRELGPLIKTDFSEALRTTVQWYIDQESSSQTEIKD